MSGGLNPEIYSVFIAGIATLAIFSFVIKENPFYRIFEHVFIGIAAGLGVVVAIKTFLWPKILEPMLGLDIVQYPDGTFSKTYDPFWLLYLVPIAIGLLYYFIYSRRFSWLAKIVIGLSLGASGGLSFQGFLNEMMPQVVGSFKTIVVVEPAPLAPPFVSGALVVPTYEVNYSASIENIFFLFTLVSVMFYFFFSYSRKSKLSMQLSSSGRWLLMICFGAFFGSTVMARMALLVERLQFLINDWSSAVKAIFGLL